MNRIRSKMTEVEVEKESTPYVSPKELMARWRCSRSQVDRIATREGFTRLLLGRGKNGMVRYLWAEVVRLEEGAKA